MPSKPFPVQQASLAELMDQERDSQKAFLDIMAGPPAERLVFREKQIEQDRLELSAQALKIGRNPNLVDLYIVAEPYEISSISRTHCSIYYDEELGVYMLRDEGSTNGTWIGQEQLKSYEGYTLQDGDIITIGLLNQGGLRLRYTSNIVQNKRNSRIIVRPKERISKTEQLLDGEIADVVSQLQAKQDHIDELAASMNDPDVDESKSTFAFQKRKLFISYSRANTNAMILLKTYLETKGFLVYTDEKLIGGEESWQIKLGRMIQDSHCLVVLLTPSAVTSMWVFKEIEYAIQQHKRIIPLFIEGDSSIIPLILSGTQFIDLRNIPFDQVSIQNDKHARALDRHIYAPLMSIFEQLDD